MASLALCRLLRCVSVNLLGTARSVLGVANANPRMHGNMSTEHLHRKYHHAAVHVQQPFKQIHPALCVLLRGGRAPNFFLWRQSLRFAPPRHSRAHSLTIGGKATCTKNSACTLSRLSLTSKGKHVQETCPSLKRQILCTFGGGPRTRQKCLVYAASNPPSYIFSEKPWWREQIRHYTSSQP